MRSGDGDEVDRDDRVEETFLFQDPDEQSEDWGKMVVQHVPDGVS